MTRRTRHRRTAVAAAFATAGALALGACSTGGTAQDGAGDPLEVSGAYMPEPVMSEMAGGFLVIANHGDEDDTLTKVTSGIAASVEMHRTEDGAMQRVDSLPVPAGGELALERGGKHLMFHDLTRKPDKGDTVTVKLHFAHHEPVSVTVPVKAAHHDPAAGDAGDHH